MRLKGTWHHSWFNKHKNGRKEAIPKGTNVIRVETSFGMMELVKA